MVTMQDIADSAQVSRGTVSYVLNGKYKKAKISEATKDKILAAAEKLGYRRNAIAQSMKTGKTNVIGFIGALVGEYVFEIINGINDIVSKNNYMIKLLPVKTSADVKKAARQCVEQRLAGVICRLGAEKDTEILQNELQPHNIPVILVDAAASCSLCSHVYSDDYSGGQKAVKYLWKLGHRNIVNVITTNPDAPRNLGYQDAILELGGKIQRIIIPKKLKILPVCREIIKQAIAEIKPSAFFCESDPVAMQILNVASTLKIKIPQELSVIGFGGLNYTIFSNPALTTLKQPFVEIGRKASEILLTEINEKSEIKKVKLPVELIIRDSVMAIK